MIKLFAFIAITACFNNDLRVQSQDPDFSDYCMLYQKGGDDYWSPDNTYCCKDCCLTTLGSAK